MPRNGFRNMPFKLHAAGLTVSIRLTPNARQCKFDGMMDVGEGRVALKVSVNAVPEDGAANKALIEFLAKSWRLPKTTISLFAGHTSRLKVVLIEGDGEKLQKQILEKF